METSSAETGSSQTMKSGFSASARARPMRWRWPPENSCGYREAASGARPTIVEELADALARLAPLGDAVDAERLAHDPPHAVARVQGRVRVLEDHLHAPAQRPQGALAEVRDVLAVEDHVPVRGLVEAQDRPAERGLAAAGLAHEPERLAALDGEGDVVDGLDVADVAVEQEPALDREPHLQVLDVDERAARRHRMRGRLSQLRPPSTSPTPPRARG